MFQFVYLNTEHERTGHQVGGASLWFKLKHPFVLVAYWLTPTPHRPDTFFRDWITCDRRLQLRELTHS